MAGPGRLRTAGSALGRVALVLGGLALIAAAWLYSKMPRPAAPRVEATLEVVGVHDGTAFSWILRTAHGAVLVDAGRDHEGDAILAELRRQGLGPEDVHTVLLTHGHPDHTGALWLFQKAKVYAGPGEAARMRGERPFQSPASRILLPLVGPPPWAPEGMLELKGGEDLDVDGQRIHVYAVPGHTAGSVAYLWREVLFSGDAVIGDGGQGVRLVPRFFSADVEQARESLRPLVKAPFTLMADGHTGVVADARQKLERLLK